MPSTLLRRTARLREAGPQGLGRGSRLLRRWSPLAIPGLSYYDARVAGSVTTDTGLTTPATDGQEIAGWRDLSANGRHATRATTNKPALDSDGINGRPGVLFVSANAEYLDVNGLAPGLSGTDVPYSLVAVLQKATNTTIDVVLAGSKSDATNPLLVVQTNAAAALSIQHRDDAGASKVPTGGTFTTAPTIVEVICTGTAVNAWKDSVQIITNGDGNVGALTLNQVAIGAIQDRSGSGIVNGFDGLIGALGIAPGRAITDIERLSFRRYLAAGFGITVS